MDEPNEEAQVAALKAQAVPSPLQQGPCNRLTWNVNIYHQHCGEQPTHVPLVNTVPVVSEEQPVKRRMVLGTEPKEFYFGWFEPPQVSFMLVENRTGTGQLVNPTIEESERNKRQLVYVAVSPGADPLIVRPGGHLLFEPTDPGKVRIWAALPDTPITTHVFPK